MLLLRFQILQYIQASSPVGLTRMTYIEICSHISDKNEKNLIKKMHPKKTNQHHTNYSITYNS